LFCGAGVWEHRDEYLGEIRNGRRLGVGPEPDDRAINSRMTCADFSVGELVLVWHYGVWWHATIKYIAHRRGTVTIRWPDRTEAPGYQPRLVRKVGA
jgi:hypothetical protein